VIYTIEGKKDPRLEARYIVSYVSTGTSEECTTRKLSTGTRRPAIGSKVYEVKDENYSVKIPIALTEDENNCGYRLGGLELMILRKNDDRYFQYARFKLLGDYKNIDPISLKELGGQRAYAVYDGRKGGTDGRSLLNKKESPYAFRSDKRYFRITAKTTFACMTRNSIYDYEQSTSDKETAQRLGNTDFTCTMKMKLDTDGGKYHYHECTKEESRNDSEYECGTMSHPDFGVDEITSDTLHIDIVVDESKCVKWRHLNHNFGSTFEPDSFQELPKSSPSVMKSLKSLF
jgi:hypothetical protein